MRDAMAMDSNESPANDSDREVFKQLMAAAHEYEMRFGRYVPQPAMVSDSAILREVLRALKRGKPISDEHDWYRHLPPGAVA